MYRARRKKLGNNTERAQFIVPLQPSTTNCHSLERENPAYFHIFLLSRRASRIRVTETFRKNMKNIFQKIRIFQINIVYYYKKT